MRSKLLLVVALVFALVPLTGAMAWAGGPDDYSHAETYEFWNDCTEQYADFTFVREGKSLFVADDGGGGHLMQRSQWTVTSTDGFESLGGVYGTTAFLNSAPFVGTANHQTVMVNEETGQRLRISGSRSTPECRSTSVTRSRRGSGEPTRTPTDCYVNTFPKAPT